MVEKYKKIAEYLGWNGYIYVHSSLHQLMSSLDLENLFLAIENIEKENVEFGYSWEEDGEIQWNNGGLEFNIFGGKIDFSMHKQLDPDQTIIEKPLNYSTLREDLVDMIYKVLIYLENARV